MALLAAISWMTAVTDGSVSETGVAAIGRNCHVGDSTHRPSGSALSAARGSTPTGHVADISDGSRGRICTLNWAPTKLTTEATAIVPWRICVVGSPW